MKKYIFAIALAATVLAGCQKEEFSAPAAKQSDGKTVLTATVNNGTRSTVSEDGMFAWATDDVIGAMTPEGKFAQFNLTGGSGTYSATFTSVDDNVKVEKVAVFPMEDAKALDGKRLTVTLPERFNYVAERTYSPMMAVISGNDVSKLEFKHLAGLLTVTFNHVPADAAYFYVTSPTNKIKGDFEIEDYTSEGACIKTGPVPSGSSKSSIWMDLPEEPFEGPTTFYLPLPVGEYDSLTVGFLDANYYFCGDDAKKVYEDFKVERCDMRTASLDNLGWDILYTRRGADNGMDRLQFKGCEGKWYYMYYQYAEFVNRFGSDTSAVLEALVNNCKSKSTTLNEGNKNYRLSFVFPAQATFYVMMAEMTDDYTPTGRYMVRSWTPKEESESSEGFEKWLGNWIATGKDSNGQDVTYNLTVTTYSKNEQYLVTGWVGTTTNYRVDYDQATGQMVFRNHILSYGSTKTSSSDGITYKCKGGLFGVIGTSSQNTPLFTPLAVCTLDDSGTMATMNGYQYYSEGPFETMCYYYWSYTVNANGKYPVWRTKDPATLAHFPISMTKVEVD